MIWYLVVTVTTRLALCQLVVTFVCVWLGLSGFLRFLGGLLGLWLVGPSPGQARGCVVCLSGQSGRFLIQSGHCTCPVWLSSVLPRTMVACTYYCEVSGLVGFFALACLAALALVWLLLLRSLVVFCSFAWQIVLSLWVSLL